MRVGPRIAWRGKARERFIIPGEEGHSEYWRRDKSPVELLELAKLLLAIRKIVSYVGRNTGTIVWAGMENPKGISLDPTPIMGNYPVPASKADIAIGMAVEAAYQKTEWSERFKEIALTKMDMHPAYAYKFSLYFDMAERIYADIVSNRSVLGLYTEKARDWQIHEAAKQFINPPTVTELLHVWWKVAADRNETAFKEAYVDRSVGGLVERTPLDKFYRAPLAILNSIVERLIQECPRISGVTERGEFRMNLYISIWPELLEFIKFWVGDRADPFLLSSEFREEMEEEDKEKDAVKATLLSYEDELEKNLRKKNIDFTDEVKSIVANVDDVVRIEGNDIVMRARNKVDKSLFHKLCLVLQSVAQCKTIYNRGLTSGKVDRRRLFRAPTTGAIFNLKKNFFELANDIVLLVDCTGSMAEPTKWEQTEVIYQTLFSAIKRYNSRARMVGYNEVKDICHITELHMGEAFFSVLPHGKTASGEAIIATALSLKRSRKVPFIIHITDGASNWGCGVNDAIKFCKQKRINLLTLGLGCDPQNRAALKKEYGNLIEFVDNTDHLPGLLRNLLSSTRWL